jgi:hypothetical protein
MYGTKINPAANEPITVPTVFTANRLPIVLPAVSAVFEAYLLSNGRVIPIKIVGRNNRRKTYPICSHI